MTRPLKLFLIAGELSGDRLGGDLMAGLKRHAPAVTFEGVGGPQMQAQGLTSLFNMSDLSVMGLFEILPRIPKLLGRVKETAKAIIDAKPDAIVTIDSPDFCFRVIAKVKDELPDIKVIHYVAPSVWAWRPERAEKMSKHVDHVLALLPFEPPFMTAVGMTCDFVGHPTAFQTPVKDEQVAQFKSNLDASTNPEALITLLPGSRKGEIKRMAPIFRDVMARVVTRIPDVSFLLPVATGLEKIVTEQFKQFGHKVQFLTSDGQTVEDVEREKRIGYAASQLAIATSGTVALELASEACPMVVAYKANWATTRMVKKLAQIDTANLVNIVTETRDVPEFLFENCTAENITTAVLELLENQDARARQRALEARTMQSLGRGQPQMRDAPALSVLTFLNT